MEIKIITFLDVQTMQKRYNIPFTSSISTFCWKLINALHSEGEDEVSIWFANMVIPKTYRNNPWSWVTLILKSKVLYHSIKAFRVGNQTVIKAATEDIPKQSFRPKLVASLQTSNRVSFPLSDIPYAYQSQPYKIISVLRKEGFPSLKVDITETHLTYTHNETIKKAAASSHRKSNHVSNN